VYQLEEWAVRQLVAVLQEAFEGSDRDWSYFTDEGPQAGLLGSVESLSAEEASRPVAGSSVAAHVHHVTFALDASRDWIRGEWTPRDWTDSWRVQAVDADAWQRLQRDLRRAYSELREEVERRGTSSEEAFGGAVAAVAHCAYHLGAVRQKVALLRGR
jgi:hypothetical protein